MSNQLPTHPVVVAGAGVAGTAVALALLGRGVPVTVVDRTSSSGLEALAGAGARIVISPAAPNDEALKALAAARELIVSPGFAPHHPLVAAAIAAGLEVYSEPELAWRLRGPHAPAWLAVTGTNGKTTTTTMLASILSAAGLRTAALGNIGEPLVEAAVDLSRFDVLAVELSSFQLHWSRDLAPQAGALLNLADDHLDWHGSFDSYAQAKTRIWRSASSGGTAVGNLDDPRVSAALSQVRGRRVGVTVAPGFAVAPGSAVAPGFAVAPGQEVAPGQDGGGSSEGDSLAHGQFGLVDGVLVERGADGRCIELVAADVIRPAGIHNVSNALHAAALARAAGVPATAIRDGLLRYTPEHHRNAFVATVNGVDYVDDSKATNPHAALASLLAYPHIVWVAGGQLKGVDIDDLVATVAPRLVGAVVLGIDRAKIGTALARHAPRLPVIDIASTDDGAMGEVVTAAAHLARPGDTVLLAPAAASLDMYASYAQRGSQFADAVRRLPGAPS